MTPLFKKMNFKRQERIFVLNSPSEFAAQLVAMMPFTKISTSTRSKIMDFVVIFAKQEEELNALFAKVKDKLIGDAYLWICYPKKSSRKYDSGITRDKGWYALGEADYEPVRIIAIDEDWSGLRFRKVTYIKDIKRSDKMIISREGIKKKKGE